MGFFDIFNKQKTETNKKSIEINQINEINRWDDFCKLDESFKNDSKLKPIYYLKKYGKNMIYTNSEIRNKAKSDFYSAITEKLKNENSPTIKCLADYLINKYEILDNEKLIEILNNLDKDSMETIANSHSFLSYIQMREQISNINGDEIKKIVQPLINVLNNRELNYSVFTAKYSKELRDYIYNIYNVMMNEKFENYKFNNGISNVYFYGNNLILVFDENEENPNLGIKESNIVHIQKIKRLMKINDSVFSENYRDIIWNEDIPGNIEKKFYSSKPYFIFKHDRYGDIEFYYREDEIEIKCEALESQKFMITGVEDTFDSEEIKGLYIKAIEKIIQTKEKVLSALYNYTLQICMSLKEKDENGKEISIEYIANHFSKIRISIWPQVKETRDGYSEEKTLISFAGDLYGNKGEEGGYLLGGHEIIASTVNGENVECSLNG